ncbi:MAG: ROK family transcriptional regulator, partial [Bacteroidales bacterium]|nr:ROK family transcriptional regulator [Bacteroidales bacterium]
YSVPTVTKHINVLKEDGLILRHGKTVEERGRQAMIYSINPDYANFIGVDIKHNEIIIAAIDFSGKQFSHTKISRTFENTPETLEFLCSNIDLFISSLGIPRESVKTTNVNISGRVNIKTGDSYSIFNFEDLEGPLAETLTDRIGIRTFIENDTRAMAFGECLEGSCTNKKNALFINAGWGIGMTIISDGNIYYGADGYAGELGHTNVYNNQVICHCGKKGCLETEISGKALTRKIREAFAEGKTSILSSTENIDEYSIIDAVNKEDTLCIDLIEQAGAEMGRQIANLINIFNPEAVVIGGSLLGAGDFYFQPLIQAVRKYSLRLLNKNVKILKSTLGEQAGVRGACLLARKNYISLTF